MAWLGWDGEKIALFHINETILFIIAGLFLECPGITSALLRNNLQNIQAPIQSLSIYDFDRTVTTLGNDLFSTTSSNGIQIKHLQFSNTNIQALKDNSLTSLKDALESLSIQNGKLSHVSTNGGLCLFAVIEILSI